MNTFTVYWPDWLCERVREANLEGTPLRVTCGGNYTHLANFDIVDIRKGDELAAITVINGQLFVIGCMRVENVRTDLPKWLEQHPEDDLFVLDERTYQVVEGKDGTAIRFDRPLAHEHVEAWRFGAGFAIRALADGKIEDAAALHGVHRIAPATRASIAPAWMTSADLLEELERRVMLDPTDEATVLVYADALQQAGDPRGEVIAIEHQLHQRPDRATLTVLEERLIELMHDERERLVGRLGGFPLRIGWGERRSIVCGSGERRSILKMAAGLPAFRAVRAFLEQRTDAENPERATLDGLSGLDKNRPEVAELRRLIEAILPERNWIAEPGKRAPTLTELDELLTHCDRARLAVSLRLFFRFRLTDPATRHVLPFQCGAHYASDLPWLCALDVDLAVPSIQLNLKVPFEDLGPEFWSLRKNVVELLGRSALTKDSIRLVVGTVVQYPPPLIREPDL